MATLDRSAPIELTDGEHTFLEQRGGMVQLRNCATGAYVTMHVAELAQRIVGMPPTVSTDARILETLGEERKEATLELVDHVQETIDGANPNLETPRPDYDPEHTTQEARVQAKLLELKALGIKMGRSSLVAKMSAFKRSGVVALIDGRATRDGLARTDDRAEVIAALRNVIAQQKDASTGTKSRLIFQTRRELIAEFGAENATRMMPSDPTMYRLIAEHSVGKHTTGSAQTRRSLAERPDRTFTKNRQVLPGAEVQLDSTILDVMVKIPGQSQPARPTLTIMVDAATRSILAYTFRLEAAKSVDHVALLAQALTPYQNQPDRTEFRRLVSQHNVACDLLPHEELLRLSLRRPFIYPRTIVIDNGKDFRGTPTTLAAERFGMRIALSPIHTPTTKAIVERTFGTIRTLFSQYLPGYVAYSPEQRGYKVDNQVDLLDIYGLQELFHDWVLNVYQNRPHSGLRDPLEPAVMFSPNQMADAAAELVSTIDIPLTQKEYIELLPNEKRVISSKGVRIFNTDYDSPALHQFRDRRAPYRGYGGLWAIKYDPYNPSAIWVRSPENEYIRCTGRSAGAVSAPHYATLQPDSTAPTARQELAIVSATLAGTPLHEFPAAPALPALPSHFDDDDDSAELTTFNPDED